MEVAHGFISAVTMSERNVSENKSLKDLTEDAAFPR